MSSPSPEHSSMQNPDAPLTPSVRVYDVYDDENPPPHPGAGWTRFVCLSDTHSRRFPVPPGDVLLHSGDLSAHGTIHALRKTMDWLRELEHPAKVIIAGNHDMCLDADWKQGGKYSAYGIVSKKHYSEAHDLVSGDAARSAGIHYLQNTTLDLTTAIGKTWRIHGSPGAPVYSQGAFQYDTDAEARGIYARVPTDVEILLTHTPALNLLDVTRRGKHAGCPVLAQTLTKLPACRLHVFGHIHESHGALILPPSAGHPEGLPRVEVNAALEKHGDVVIVDLRH